MLDERYALAALAARDLASALSVAAGRLALSTTIGFSIKRTVFAVSAVMAPAILTAADVAAIGIRLATAAGTLQGAADPSDISPVFYEAADASFAAAPSFASPARMAQAALARMLAESLEAAWLGNAFVAEAQTDFGDRQSAIAGRARIAAAMDASLDRIASATGQPVVDLLGQVARTASKHIATVAADLRPVVQVRTPRSAPSPSRSTGTHRAPPTSSPATAR